MDIIERTLIDLVGGTKEQYTAAMKRVGTGSHLRVLYRCSNPECGQIHEACGTVNRVLSEGIEMRDLVLYDLDSDDSVPRPEVEMLIQWDGRIASRLIAGIMDDPASGGMNDAVKAAIMRAVQQQIMRGGIGGVLIVDLSGDSDPSDKGMQA